MALPVIREVGDAEYRRLLISLHAHERTCHEFGEDHPLSDCHNLIHPVTGDIVVLKPDCRKPIPPALALALAMPR